MTSNVKGGANIPANTVYVLRESQITVSDGEQLSGITQGDGNHLMGRTLTLNSSDWNPVDISDNAGDDSFDDNDASQTLANDQTLDGTSYTQGSIVEAEYQLTVRDSDGNEYKVIGFNVNEGGGGPSYSTIEGLAFVGGVGGFPPRDVPLTVVSSEEGGGRTVSTLATPACFTQGTLIETPTGPIPVEALTSGDMVCTLDRGAQPIRHVARTFLPAAVLARHPEFRPVTIRKDSFGPGRPYRNTALSPQHRVLIDDWRAQLYFGEDDVLIAVGKLVNDSTVTVDHGARGVTYHHIAFDRHEVITGDGLASESYFMASTDSPATRAELLALFPQADTSPTMRTARTCVRGRHGVLLKPAPTCRETAPAASP